MISIEHMRESDLRFNIYGWKPMAGEIFRALTATSVTILIAILREINTAK